MVSAIVNRDPSGSSDKVSASGRPRSRSADRRVAEAAIAELAEVGYARMTMGSVAARAGVSRATVYRRAPNKLKLVLGALMTARDELDVYSTGDVRKDLEQTFRDLVAITTETNVGQALIALVAESVHNAELAAAYREMLEQPHRDAVLQTLRDARSRGEIRSSADLNLVVDLMAALLPYELLVLRRGLDEGLPARLVATLLDGILIDGNDA